MLDRVTFAYPAARRRLAQQVLQELSFIAALGQWIALLGPNGSGKSTLIRIISGILEPDAGEVRIFGRSISEARRDVGVVFQRPGLDRHMTVWENLRDAAALYGLRGEHAERLITTHLEEGDLVRHRHALVKTLSGGTGRRVDLVRALLSGPRLLVLDEPTAGLDPLARREFLTRIARHRSHAHATIIMSTHLVDEADRADRVVMMHEGRIVADGSPANLRERLGARRVTVHHASHGAPDAHEAWQCVENGWSREVSDVPEAERLAARFAAEGLAFTIAPPTLADVFASVTGASLESDPTSRPQETHS